MVVALSLILVAGVVVSGCGNGQAALQKAAIELTQYLKGTTVDFDAATLYGISEGGGEAGWKFGQAMAIYPTYYFSEATLDAMAAYVFGSPYRIGDNVSDTTYAQLTAGDQMAAQGAAFFSMPQAEQDVVATAVAGFFNRVDNDMAEAKAPADTSAYAILAGVDADAATAWAAEVTAGQDYVDRFFINLVKSFVTAYPSNFLPFWTQYDPAIVTVADIPAAPTNAQVEAVARLAGESQFKNGTAGAMYPTQRDVQSVILYGDQGVTSYADLATELPAAVATAAPYLVDAAVYANLTTAYGSIAVAEAALGPTRDAVAAGMMAAGYVSAATYAALPGSEKAFVDMAVYGTALPGPAGEWDYITLAAVPGAMLGFGSELSDLKAINAQVLYSKAYADLTATEATAVDSAALKQNMAYVTLSSSVTVTAAEGWKAAVEAGVHPRQAMYRWLSYEGVSASGAMAPMIRLSLGEFAFKITNPNDYQITIDSMEMNAQVESTAVHGAIAAGYAVDAAKLSVGDKVYVPANGEVALSLLAPTKVYDMITWQVMAGLDSTTGGDLAKDVFDQIQAGTVAWVVTLDVTMSNEEETIVESYPLSWAPS